MRTFGRTATILGLQPIAGAFNLSQDPALLFFFLDKAAKPHRERSQVLGVGCEENLTASGFYVFPET
jgi:hypothetical protein